MQKLKFSRSRYCVRVKTLRASADPKSMSLISQYIAPWALPRENIPLHLTWDPSVSYDNIRIDIPPDIALNEFFNVDSYTQKNNQYLITKLKTRNFFGFVVASKDITKEPHIRRKISITFILDDTEIFSHDFIANIYRPFVSFVDSPKTVIITEESKEPPRISLKVSGFGRIEIRNEVSTGGEFIARAEPLYRAIIRRMISTFRLDEETEKREKGITINPIFLQNTAKEYIERIRKRDFPLKIETEVLEDFQEWVGNEENRAKVMELISRNIESHLVDSLLFYFEKYPEYNVQMPQGNPVMLIEHATRQIRLRFRYRDAMMNEYEPIEVQIGVDDKRRDRKQPLELPLDIKWILETIDPSVECE